MIQKLHDIKRVAVFPGSFNPFTIGHYSIVERGLKLFDKVVVAIGYNEQKSVTEDLEKRLDDIRRIFGSEPNVEIACYSGLTVDYAKRIGAQFLLRGVRSYSDFEYERNMADVNRRISGIETVLLFTLPEHSYISSSVVRELQHNNADVSEFLPSLNND